MAYNSNRIEGSRLSKEHTYNLFKTATISTNGNEVIDKNDIIETSNHFHAFDYILDTIKEPLTEKYIKSLHYILKQATDDAFKSWFNVGEYKRIQKFLQEKARKLEEKGLLPKPTPPMFYINYAKKTLTINFYYEK